MNRFLALCGAASRRKANLSIAQGRVVVNDDCVQEMGHVIDPERDRVYLDGHRLEPPRHFRYILMNKPRGVITAVTDERGRKTVLDLVPVGDRVFPVGRLDYDTEGILLLTNDGELAYRLAHPKYQMEKIYRAWVIGLVEQDAIQQLNRGVVIDRGVTVKGDAKILKKKRNQTLVEIRVHEGKKRQIKRMMKSVGHSVHSLERIRFAGLKSNGLKRGEWRDLTGSEVNRIYRMTGLKRRIV